VKKNPANINGNKPVLIKNKSVIDAGVLDNILHAGTSKVKNTVNILTGNKKTSTYSFKNSERTDNDLLINFTDDLFWSVSKDFKLITANNAFIRDLEDSADISVRPGDFLLMKDVFPEEFLAFWEISYRRALTGEHFKEEIFSPAFNRRKASWTETSFNPIYKAGVIYGVACFSRNITERKLANEKIRESELRYRSLIEQATDAICIADASMKIVDINHSGCRMLGYAREEFLQLSIDDIFITDDLMTNPLKIDEMRSGKVVWNERRFKKKDGTVIHVEMNAKILDDGRFVVFAHDITERKNTEADLLKVYEEKNTILERIDDGFFAVDKNAVITYWNKNAESLLDAKREDVIGKNLHEIFASTASRAFYDNYQKAARDKSTVHFVEFSKRSNKWFAVSAYGSDNGLSVYFKDVTEQKTADEKIRESEAKYRTLFEQNMAGIYQTTAGGEILNCNNAFAKMLKYDSPAELLKINASKLYFSNTERNDFTSKVTSLQSLNNYETVLKCKDGSPLHIIENIMVSKDDITGEAFFNGIMIDVTEKKRAELQLKESNERYNLISRVTNDMVWDWDLVTGKVYRNKEGWKKLFRTGDRDIENELIEDWDNRIHPDDEQVVKQVSKDIRESLKDFFEVECRMRRDDGTYVYIHDRGYIMRDKEGHPLRVIGATQDTTQRKQAELQVAKSELRFRSLVQNSSDLICVFNNNGHFIYSSPAIKKMLGFEPDDIIGKNAFALVHPDDVDNLKGHLSQTSVLVYKEIPLIRFKNKEGAWRWMESKVTDMRDNPEVAGYVFNCRDITERLFLEKELENEKLLKQQQITEAVILAQEQERQELGAELHDNVTQILAGSILYLGLAKKELKVDHPYLKETDNLVNAAITEIRKLSHALISPSLNESEFLDALKNVIAITKKTSGIMISLQASGFDNSNTPDKLKLTIYRIVQEQINNILKHAAAQKVIVNLVKDNKKTLLSIKDDGVGFDTSAKANGVGLLNIKTRASLFNGEVSIISAPGKGCELRVLFN
jgi:PAS domain S-box-containing protein